MSSKTRQQLEAWIAGKKVSGKVLDIGGSQNPIEGRIQSEGADFWILDLPQPHETKKAPQLELDLNTQAYIDSGDFDYAVCLEVSEYWYDPVVALFNINKFLKKNGTLYISFHFIYPVHNPINADFLRYTRLGAMKLLKNAGFEIVEITPRKAAAGATNLFFMREQMRPARGWDFHDEVGVLIEAKKK